MMKVVNETLHNSRDCTTISICNESPVSTYITSWKINPGKKPDLNYDDWHEGFVDGTVRKFPAHPVNIAYMQGWMQALGMQAGYDGSPPAINEKSYLEGYSQGKYERDC